MDLPLVSKHEHSSSFIMKHIAVKTNLLRWRNSVFSFAKKKKDCVPSNAVVVDADFKGRLLDRIESLEDRLIQISLEIETRRTSRMTEARPSRAREPISSYPIFNNPNPKCKQLPSNVLPISTGCELQKRSQRLKQKQTNGKSHRDDKKTFKNWKKKGMKAHSWPHLKILGC